MTKRFDVKFSSFTYASSLALLVMFTARSEVHNVLFLALSVTVFFVQTYEISLESLIRFPPNSHRKRVWSLAQTSLNVKLKGQGHQRKIPPR